MLEEQVPEKVLIDFRNYQDQKEIVRRKSSNLQMSTARDKTYLKDSLWIEHKRLEDKITKLLRHDYVTKLVIEKELETFNLSLPERVMIGLCNQLRVTSAGVASNAILKRTGVIKNSYKLTLKLKIKLKLIQLLNSW